MEDFSEQQTQGSFESVGTNYILTKSLDNDEHLGWTRGQSKFVRQSHYFNIMQSSKNNTEVSAVKRAYMDYVPIDTVHGTHLGEENVRVTITVPKLKRALLPIPTNESTIMEEAVGGFVAWLKRLIVIKTSLSQASRDSSHVPDREVKGNKCIKKRAGKKKVQLQPEEQQQLPPFNLS
ncbi:hypothetical protein TIFTF001_017269 [Ficus carica]|uniref:DUF8039 domain-containing protein n=1 Tax=Ficus carica TaxID=3494 RepID=A0AA88AU63_FICCA|nr:hypothetical protein TIFTF001_017269 [Ficus carica]